VDYETTKIFDDDATCSCARLPLRTTWGHGGFHAFLLIARLCRKHVYISACLSCSATTQNGISCPSQAKNVPVSSCVAASMIPSNCFTPLSFVKSLL